METESPRKGTDQKRLGHRDVRGPRRQRGAVLALVAVGMLAIIGMAGLALQSGHLFVNKTHLQNALDAAALSAAKTLKAGASVATAGAAGRNVFEEHVAPESGNSTFLEREMRDSSYTLAFEFSATLDPFNGGATETSTPPATFVRAKVTGLSMDTWLANVLPGIGDEQDIGGTAVAGPAPIDPNNTCDIAPLLMCAGVPDDPAGGSDTDCSDGECYGYTDTDCSDGACFGYNPGPNEEIVLYDDQHGEVGPGNFHLLRLGDSHGAADIRDQWAGGYSGCASVGENLDTQPGVDAGPVRQGFNTRFGIYTGGMSSSDGAPDTVTYSEDPGADTNPDANIGICTFCYDDYAARQDSGQYNYEPPPNGIGVAERRVLAVPIGRCPAEPNPTVQVLDIGCFFMTRPVKTTGGKQEIYGQLISECQVDGAISTAPPGGDSLRYKIVLYKDPDSRDS